MSEEREPIENEGDWDFGGRLGSQLLSAAREETSSLPASHHLRQALARNATRKTEQRRVALRISIGTGLALAAGVLVSLFPSYRAAQTIAPEPAKSQDPRTKRETPRPKTPPRACVVASGLSPLIDDFEDQDARVLANEGRDGIWFSNNDGSGKQFPGASGPLRATALPKKRGTSRFALESQGSRFDQWGAALGFPLAEGQCYDASAYAGVTFWAKGPGRVELQVLMDEVVPLEQGGSCEKDCFASHAKPIQLDAHFRKMEVEWGELHQPNFGAKVDFDPRRVRMILFAVKAADTPYHFWVDDLAFLKK